MLVEFQQFPTCVSNETKLKPRYTDSVRPHTLGLVFLNMTPCSVKEIYKILLLSMASNSGF